MQITVIETVITHIISSIPYIDIEQGFPRNMTWCTRYVPV